MMDSVVPGAAAAALDEVPAPMGLQKLQALEGLRVESRAALENAARRLDLQPGDVFIREGDTSNELYVIEQGTVCIFHLAEGEKQEKVVARLSAGELLGEIALIDDGPRTLSARADTPCILTEICPARVLAQPGGQQHLADLKGALSQYIVKRVRSQTSNLVASLRRELELARTRQQFGQFFLFIFTILCSGMIVTNTIAQGVIDIDINSDAFVYFYSILLGVPSLLVIWKMRVPLSDLGVTRVGFRKSFVEGVVVSALTAVVVAVVAYVLTSYDALPGQPRPFDPFGASIYFVHSFLQELMGRGVIQTSFQKFLDHKSGIPAVVLTAIIFATMHIHLGITAVGLTFSGSILFGLFYLRHYNLIGVTLVHFTVGAAAFLSGLL